jgi:hypothetical protein
MYTHYFTPKKVTQEKWNEFVKEVKELKKNLPLSSESAGGYYQEDKILIRGGLGTGKAIFNKDEVCFNGDEKKGLDHETFYCSRESDEWGFCKTARKPYDILVCAVLIAAHNILGYEVTSDGNLEDWRPAIDYYSDVIYDEPILEMDDDLIKHIIPEFLYEEIKFITQTN